MRQILTTSGVILCLAAYHAISTNGQEPQGLNFVAKIAQYYGTGYVKGPNVPARHVYFDSETVLVALELGNTTDRSQRLSASGSIAKGFRVVTRQSPSPAQTVRLLPEPRGVVTTGAVRSGVDWGGDLDIDPRATVTWMATLIAPGPPGFYEFQILPEALSAQIPIHPQGTLIRLEKRASSTVADRAEMARRRVMHEYNFGSDAAAIDATEQLLRIHPTSAVAYQFKGLIAQRTQRTTEARAAFSQALELLTNGGDSLYLKEAGRDQTGALVANLKRALQTLP